MVIPHLPSQQAPSKLVIGVPSKGRLQENTFAFFARAGFSIHQPRGGREYRGTMVGIEGVEIAFLSASEIVKELARGAIHFGVTGADLIHEELSNQQEYVEMLAPLGFGYANVVVGVPQGWIDVFSMADMEEIAADLRLRQGRRLRVATKYINLTRRFFKENGVADYRIVESSGATEGAPAAGSADLIVDITTTGATLAANGLKILEDGVILKSEAHLVAARRAAWTPEVLEVARLVLNRIVAEEDARLNRELRVYFTSSFADGIIKEIEAVGGDILTRENHTLCLLIAGQKAAPLADQLVALGAKHVLVTQCDYAFSPKNTLFERLKTII